MVRISAFLQEFLKQDLNIKKYKEILYFYRLKKASETLKSLSFIVYLDWARVD